MGGRGETVANYDSVAGPDGCANLVRTAEESFGPEDIRARAKEGPGPVEHVAPIVTWLCTDAAADVRGRVFDPGGGKINVWSELEDLNTITKVDPDENPPYTLEELDRLVPGSILK